MYFPFFYVFLCIFPFYVFLPFCVFTFLSFLPFCGFYLFVVNKGVSVTPTYSSIAMRKSDLCNSLRTERWLSCFILFFERLIFVANKSRLRRWTFKRSFDFLKEIIVKAPDPFERSLDF